MSETNQKRGQCSSTEQSALMIAFRACTIECTIETNCKHFGEGPIEANTFYEGTANLVQDYKGTGNVYPGWHCPKITKS